MVNGIAIDLFDFQEKAVITNRARVFFSPCAAN